MTITFINYSHYNSKQNILQDPIIFEFPQKN